jgi:parallel beta-helix repeat protein
MQSSPSKAAEMAPLRRRRSRSAPRRPHVTFHLLALIVGFSFVADLAGQAPAPPTNVRVLVESEGPPPEPPTFSGTTVYVSPSGADTNSGSESSPVRTIQRGVQLAEQLHAAGTPARVLIAAGVYRETVNLLAGGQKTNAPIVIEGAGPGTVLSGADVFTAWKTESDGSLTHHWPHKWGMKAVPSGWTNYWNWDGNGYKRDILRRSETVFVNGSPLRGVLALTELTAGTFYVDETTERLHVRLPTGVALAGATIEVGMRTTPLNIAGRRFLTLKNFAVHRSRGALQDSAVRVASADTFVAEGLDVRWMAYTGFSTVTSVNVTVRRSVFSDNGVMGHNSWRDRGYLFEDSEVARNNWRGYPAAHVGWDTVQKFLQVRDLIARRLRIVDNWGSGFWLDYDNQRVTFRDSLVSGNKGNQGVYLEKNQGPVLLENNRICNNTNAGIADAQSEQITVRGNQVFDNGRYQFLFTGNQAGQTVVDYLTGQSKLLRSRQWTVVDNAVAGSGNEGWLWWHTDSSAWTEFRTTAAEVDRNLWWHGARGSAFRLPQGTVAHTTYRADLQAMKPAHEVNSSWQAAAALSCTMP